MKSKTLEMAVRMTVTLTIDVEGSDDGANVVNVRRVSNPTPKEVMDAIDGEGQLDELDALYGQP